MPPLNASSGIIDIHVHYFPERVFRAIWTFFETHGHGLWSIREKIHGETIIERLRAHGVERFTTLVYAHRPAMAAYLNDFVAEAVATHPETLIPFGTVFAGDGADCAKEGRRIFEQLGFSGIKLHPFVSQEPLNTTGLLEVYEMMESLGRVLICHPGSGPNYAKKDGARDLEEVLTRFPRLKTVVAHCGAAEYGDYQRLADRFENVYFDTAMNCVDHAPFTGNCPGREFFTRYGDRVLFGSDYPNLPYAYEDQLNALRRLNLPDVALQKIVRENAMKLLAGTEVQRG